MTRIRALIAKELQDVARNLGTLIPVLIATLVLLVLPFVIAVLVPSMTGQSLGDDADLVKASRVVGLDSALSTNGRVQLFLFQQFLMLFLLVPITGAMALAAHAIVGEKQARTLEPLLATPLTTFELLVAKVIGALLPTLAISLVGLGLYVSIVAAAAEPGVMPAMVNARTVVLVFGVAPVIVGLLPLGWGALTWLESANEELAATQTDDATDASDAAAPETAAPAR